MKIRLYWAFTITMMVATACGGDKQAKTDEDAIVSSHQVPAGDSTIYGLACDGCTDTILVFLRDIDSDPDTFNILAATKNHRIYGRPDIGDKVAVVRNQADSTVADIVINMETLRGAWAYEVTPTPRPRADMPGRSEAELLRQIPDSIRDSLMTPREYGFLIRGEGSVSFVGRYYRSDDDNSPVEFPHPKHYRQWHLYNGKLVLIETKRDSLGQEHATNSDTASFIMLTPDTLVLQFKDSRQGYYRKKDTDQTVN